MGFIVWQAEMAYGPFRVFHPESSLAISRLGPFPQWQYLRPHLPCFLENALTLGKVNIAARCS